MKHFKLYGFLADEFGADHWIDVKTPAEAVRALCCTIDGFEERIAGEKIFGFALFVDEIAVEKESIEFPVSEKEVVKLVPQLMAAKDGWTNIMIGIAMIALVWATSGTGVGLYASMTGATGVSALAVNMGLAMMIGGVSTLLAASPGSSDGSIGNQAQHPSFVFSGAINTTAQGNAIGVLYGRLLTGSQVASSGIDSNVFPGFAMMGAADDVGTVSGNGDSSPWVAVVAPTSA